MCDISEKKGKDNTDGKEDGEYIRLAYQSTLADIRFFKQQQWLLTYYTLLIYAAIIATVKLNVPEPICITCNLCAYSLLPIKIIITLVITTFLVRLLYVLEKSLKKHRGIKNKLIQEFPKLVKDIYNSEQYKSDKDEEDFSFTVVKWLIIIGCSLTIALLYFSSIAK